jgi:flavin-dependent dehydrogenase
MGVDVVMFDPRAPWEKPCGGGLTAAALDTTPELMEVAREGRTITSVRLESARTEVVVALDRPIHIVSRVELSRWHLERARRAGAALERVAVRQISRRADGGWELTTSDGRRTWVRHLVGADGAASLVRKAVAPELDIELAPARVAFVPGAGPAPSSMGLRFFRGVPGYAWDFPRSDHRSIGVGVAPGVWARPEMDAEVDRYRADLDSCICAPAPRAGAVIGTAARPLGSRYHLLGRRDYALLGDAAGLADPATGEGIQNAIRSADFLARAFEQEGNFASYAHLVERNLEREFVLARRVRRVLYSASLAPRLIDLAASHRWAYALLATVVNGGNAHDPSLVRRFVVEWHRASPGWAGSAGGAVQGMRETVRDASQNVLANRLADACSTAGGCECRPS